MVLSFFCTFGLMGCLDKIVGLTRKDCECFTTGRPADYADSVSGLYLDELTGLTQKAIETSTDCGEGTIWDIMLRALENGHRRFRTDLLSNLNRNYKERFPPFEGIIGDKTFNGTAPTVQDNYVMGLRIDSNCIKGSCFILKGIESYFDTDFLGLDVNIYRSDCPDPIDTFTIDATAFKKKINTLPTPIELPLYIDGLDEFYYSLVYTLPVGVKPLNTKLQCKCNNNKKRKWRLWADIGGIITPSFTTVEALDDLGSNDFTYGMNMNAQILCKKAEIICQEGHVWDFENDEIALQIAHAIQEISGVILINEVLMRPDSAYFQLNAEQLSQIGAQLASSYQDRVDYLSLNIKPNNDCWICGDQMKMVGIKS